MAQLAAEPKVGTRLLEAALLDLPAIITRFVFPLITSLAGQGLDIHMELGSTEGLGLLRRMLHRPPAAAAEVQAPLVTLAIRVLTNMAADARLAASIAGTDGMLHSALGVLSDPDPDNAYAASLFWTNLMGSEVARQLVLSQAGPR